MDLASNIRVARHSSPWEAAAITTCTYYLSIIQLSPIYTFLTLTCCCAVSLTHVPVYTGPLLQTGIFRVINTQSIEAAAYWRLLCRTLHGQGGVGGQYNIVGGSPRPGTLPLLGAAREMGIGAVLSTAPALAYTTTTPCTLLP